MILKLELYVEVDLPQEQAAALKTTLSTQLHYSVNQTLRLKGKKLTDHAYADDWADGTKEYRRFLVQMNELNVRTITPEQVIERMRSAK